MHLLEWLKSRTLTILNAGENVGTTGTLIYGCWGWVSGAQRVFQAVKILNMMP